MKRILVFLLLGSRAELKILGSKKKNKNQQKEKGAVEEGQRQRNGSSALESKRDMKRGESGEKLKQGNSRRIEEVMRRIKKWRELVERKNGQYKQKKIDYKIVERLKEDDKQING